MDSTRGNGDNLLMKIEKTQKNSTRKVVIIGGGFAGLSCAIGLAKQGHQVTVFEREKSTKRKVCGEYLSPSGVYLAHKLGFTDILKNYKPVVGMNLIAPNLRLVTTNFPFSAGLSLNREQFEKDLFELAQSLGVRIFRGEPVQSIDYIHDGWMVEGESYDLLIGADGRNSFVSKSLGLHQDIEEKKVALHFYVTRKSNFQRRGEMIVLGDGGYIGINPINESEDNVSWVGPASMIKDAKGKDQFIKALLHHPRLIELYSKEAKISPVSAVTNIRHNVSNVIAKNAALIGDAAGFIDPLTGEGMTRAYEAVWILLESLQKHEDLNLALGRYAEKKRALTRQKNILNTFFQWVIRKPMVSNLIGYLLSKSSIRADIFIGIIGNLYSPLQGLRYLIMPPSKGESHEHYSIR